MINTKFIALVFLTLLNISRVSAAEDHAAKEISEDDYLGEVPRVLTVSRLSQSIEDAPSAVTVIDRETIRASGIVDLPEIFRLVPGFYVGANAGFVHNTNHVVSYHGITTAYAGAMQVLINGRSVYSPLYGGVQWSELPIAIADIERLEITRGPNAASYGANSFFGVINIITQSPADQPGVNLSATYGNGRHEAFARYGAKQGDLSYRFTAGFRSDDGLDNRNDFKRTRLLNAQADYRVNDKNNLEFEFGFANGDREDGDINQDPVVFLPRSVDMNNHFELVRWRHNVNENSDFTLQAFHSHDQTKDDVTSSNLRPYLINASIAKFGLAGAQAIGASLLNDTVSINNEMIAERYDLEAQHTFSISPSFRGVWGASIRKDTMYAPFYLGSSQTDTFNLQRLFAHVEWRPKEQIVLNLGSMVEHNSFTGTDVSPRASVNFKLNPNHTLRFGVSSAMRTPSYLDNKFNESIILPTKAGSLPFLSQFVVGTGNLKPEKIVSKEIGYLADFGQLSLDTRVFHDNISDYIKTMTDTTHNIGDIVAPGYVLIKQPRVSINGGDVAVNGFEAQAKLRINNDTRLLFNYAYVDIDADKNQTANDINESMPRNTISALLTHRFNSNWDASYAYYQTGNVTALGDGDQVGLARRSDIRVARKFKTTRASGEVSVVVENLFNDHYQEFADYNTLKRRARLNVSLDF